jgi:hypothetical protein
MGMDQYLIAIASNGQTAELAYWRKNYALQDWFESVARNRRVLAFQDDCVFSIVVRREDLAALSRGFYHLANSIGVTMDQVLRAGWARKAGFELEYWSNW